LSPRPADSERAAVVQKILDLLSSLDERECARVLRTVATYFDIPLISHHAAPPPASAAGISNAAREREPVFSGHEPISAKEFLRHKQPTTDVERAMCLAYYLAHYKDLPTFKTADIAKLNTEAAQRKFANTAYTVNNAATTGYFVAAPGGNRQLSSMGEQYVEALPDRAAARALAKGEGRKRRAKNARRRG
jgi:hypothetical protein